MGKKRKNVVILSKKLWEINTKRSSVRIIFLLKTTFWTQVKWFDKNVTFWVWKSLIQELNSHCNSKNMMLIQSYSKLKKIAWKNANNLIEIFDILFTSTHYKIQFLTFLLLKGNFNKKGKKFVKMATFLIMKCWFFR